MNVYDDEEHVDFVMAPSRTPTVAWPLEDYALPHVPDQPVAAEAAEWADLHVVPRLVLHGRWPLLLCRPRRLRCISRRTCQ